VIRSEWAAQDHHVIARFETFELDARQRQLRRDGKPIHLTPKAFDFLLLLIEEAPRIVRKEELHKRLWPDTFVVDATLVSVVKEVRRALGDHASASPIIRTAHRVGYGFAAALERNVTPVSTVSRWLMVGRRRISLAGLEHVIGRDPASAIHIDAPGVSRRHARIVLDRAGAVIEDLGSKNGTAVNGQPLDGTVMLKDGDEIRLGPVVILYRCSTRGESTETVARNAEKLRR
jgi:DNA-binding winged helix-turn-helix (wHTH) protein